MKLLFDARFIRTDFHDGISRYSTELAGALAQVLPVTFIICDQAQLALLPSGAPYVLLHAPTSWKEPFSSLCLNKFQPDIVISPMQTLGSFGRRFQLILTLHDLIYYRHRTPPRNLSWPIRLGWRLYHLWYWPQRLALNGADVVATVSQTSKADILAHKLTTRPVIVVPNAPQRLQTLLEGQVVHGEAPTHLVYMGSFMTYKNVETLIRGMEFLPGYTLHLLSRISATRRKELETCVTHGAQVVFHNGVSDTEYAEMLADNALLVSASLDEGYGLPLAEALELGVPAVVSDLPIFHEVAGEGALYFNPRDPRDFADKVHKAAQPKIYNQLSANGKQHIKAFSWQASAEVLKTAILRLLA